MKLAPRTRPNAHRSNPKSFSCTATFSKVEKFCCKDHLAGCIQVWVRLSNFCSHLTILMKFGVHDALATRRRLAENLSKIYPQHRVKLRSECVDAFLDGHFRTTSSVPDPPNPNPIDDYCEL
jgi:hypothetical protein